MNNQFCLVALLERYILQADIDLSSLPLFRPVLGTTSPQIRINCTVISFLIHVVEMFKDCLKELYGYDSSLYGIHSPRAGGATAVVNSNNSILKDFS